MKEYDLKKSADGTYTLYSKEYDECYHSLRDGAFREALYKHVIPAFSLVKKDTLAILDICFGLGINTLTTLYYFYECQQKVKKLRIFSPELDSVLLQKLYDFSYPVQLQPYLPILFELLQKKRYESHELFIELYVGDAREYIKKLSHIDIVYQDAFSPKKNPTLWTVEYFKDIAHLLTPTGVLTTYSIATPVRLALYEAGFRIYEHKIEGIKKITIASKTELPLQEIDMQKKRQFATSSPLRDNRVQND